LSLTPLEALCVNKHLHYERHSDKTVYVKTSSTCGMIHGVYLSSVKQNEIGAMVEISIKGRKIPSLLAACKLVGSISGGLLRAALDEKEQIIRLFGKTQPNYLVENIDNFADICDGFKVFLDLAERTGTWDHNLLMLSLVDAGSLQ